MLATRVRVRPCKARLRGASSGRETRIAPSSRVTVISRGMTRLSSPRGPLTRTVAPSMASSTFAGTGIGRLPMRDMLAHLPDIAEDLAAHLALPCLLAGHDSLRRGQNGDPKAAVY